MQKCSSQTKRKENEQTYGRRLLIHGDQMLRRGKYRNDLIQLSVVIAF